MDISTRLHVLHVNFGYIFLECDQIIVPEDEEEDFAKLEFGNTTFEELL